MKHRNRSSGWQYAKLSGHENETLVKKSLDNDKNFQNDFLCKIKHPKELITETSIGGLHEKNVPSINKNTTKSKTDLKVSLNNGKKINISIKKSLSGQVYLVSPTLFISTFEKQFRKKIPAKIQRGINLFWGNADDTVQIIEKYADKTLSKTYNLQMRHKSLNATTLKAYDSHLYNLLLKWFIDNAYLLAKLSFSMGAASNKEDWSEFIWYINLIKENDINDIFHIEDICKAVQIVAKSETYFSPINGGTTIQLPFGFVQWHQKKIQFHHCYEKLHNLVKQAS